MREWVESEGERGEWVEKERERGEWVDVRRDREGITWSEGER